MDQAHWMRLSLERVGDAQLLLANGRWPGAYYLAGYAVECRLKACIVSNVQKDPGLLYRNKDLLKEIWTHKLPTLIAQTGLLDKLDEELDLKNQSRDKQFADNWLLVSKWSENTRYDLTTESDAKKLFAAVNEPIHGVLAWIEKNS